MTEETDCTFLYFKPGGKWKYEGRGRFPRPHSEGFNPVDREAIKRENNGMPGIRGDASDYIIVVIPDETCEVNTAYPRMLYPDENLVLPDRIKKLSRNLNNAIVEASREDLVVRINVLECGEMGQNSYPVTNVSVLKLL